MIRKILLTVATVMACTVVRAVDFPGEDLGYDIYYRCSFINEAAAEANVYTSCYDGNFTAVLGGSSKPIMGVIYCVNDTLQASFIPSGETTRPATENVEYMSGYYRKPHDGDRTDINSPSAYRTIYGQGSLSCDASTIEFVTLTADLLNIFYYAKSQDFGSMQQGVAVDVPVRMPDGQMRTMQLLYLGMSEYQGRPAWSVVANFTYDGEMSAFPVRILIDTERRVPVTFSAHLTIGYVEMCYRY